MRKKYLEGLSFVALLLLITSACNKDFGPGDAVDYRNTVKSKVDELPQFSFYKKLYQFIDSSTDAIKPSTISPGTTYPLIGAALGSNSVTAFIPTNDVFINNGITSITINGAINPALIPFISRDSALANDRVTLNSLRTFAAYFISNSLVEQATFSTDSFQVKSVTGVATDSLFIRKMGNDFLINANAKVDVGNGMSMRNGRLYAINDLLTPTYAGTFIALARVDTSLTLFNRALTRANDPAITQTANNITIRSTIFAPTNQAFIQAGYTASVIAATPPATLRTLLKHHIIRQRMFTTDLTDGSSLLMLDGTTVTIAATPVPTIKSLNTPDPANLLLSNILVARGIVHKIDRVLIP